ncbi:MAG TPA: thioredoxin family protein [Gammaproteobacteria bacterium]
MATARTITGRSAAGLGESRAGDAGEHPVPVKAEPVPRVKVEVFTAGDCASCAYAKAQLSRAIAALGPERFDLRIMDVVEEIDHAVASGVLATPAIAINGALIFSGLPTQGKLRRALEKCLSV